MKRLNQFVNAIGCVSNNNAIIHISKDNASRYKENTRINIALLKKIVEPEHTKLAIFTVPSIKTNRQFHVSRFF
jgi:hypothetical protein